MSDSRRRGFSRTAADYVPSLIRSTTLGLFKVFTPTANNNKKVEPEKLEEFVNITRSGELASVGTLADVDPAVSIYTPNTSIEQTIEQNYFDTKKSANSSQSNSTTVLTDSVFTDPSNSALTDSSFIQTPTHSMMMSVSEEIPAIAPTASAKPLLEMIYDEEKPIGQSSHPVYEAHHINNKNERHYVKVPPSDEMACIECFLGAIGEMSYLYGAQGGVVRYKNGQPLKTSSKGIAGFHTFKDGKLTQEQLENSSFRTRLLRSLAIEKRELNDDFHRGNGTNEPSDKSSPGLQFFDFDDAFKPVTSFFKPRLGVDAIVVANRIVWLQDPKKRFITNDEEKFEIDIRRHPNFVTYNPFYYPSRGNPWTEAALMYVKQEEKDKINPWTAEEVAVVQRLEGHPDNLPISFEEFIDWMILTLRFRQLAKLYIPDRMTEKSTGKCVIDLYSELNEEVNEFYKKVLPKMPEFQEFIETQKETILRHLLVRTMIRNARLVQKQEEVINDPKRKHFSKQFDGAFFDVHQVIDEFNKVIESVESLKVLTESVIDKSVINKPQTIDKIRREELIAEAEQIAQPMIVLENKIGTHDWTKFEHFDYKLKPQVPKLTEQLNLAKATISLRK